MAITTTAILPAPVQQSFSYKLLSVPTPNFIHKIAADTKKLKSKGGTTLRMRRYNALPTAMVALGNTGVTPPPTSLTAVDIDAEMSFYGMYIQLNEQVVLQSQDPVLNEATKRLGVSLRHTEDQLTRDMLAASATEIRCTAGTNGDNPTNINRWDIDLAVRTLMGHDARTILDSIDAEDKFGTGPTRDSYMALCHSDLTADLNRVSGFLAKTQYPAPAQGLRSEYGSVGNMRFLTSSAGSTIPLASNNGATIYNVFVVGMEAYCCVEQNEYSSEFIYRPPIYDGPLALNATAGYKFAEVPRITNDNWVFRLTATLQV